MTNTSAQLIDGIALSQQLRNDVTRRAAMLKARGITPGLAVILVGDNPASQVYVRNKVKACVDSGLHSVLEKYDASMSEAELLSRIDALNRDPSIHGILVQLPLPAHIDAHKVIESISPAKDVDGFHVASAGALMVGQPGFQQLAGETNDAVQRRAQFVAHFGQKFRFQFVIVLRLAPGHIERDILHFQLFHGLHQVTG